MSARSLKIAIDQIKRVKAARKRCGFASQQAFATESGFSLSTVKSFLNGRPVDRLNFVELCEKLGLDWQAVAAREAEAEAEAEADWEESLFVVGPPITKPRQFFGRERELRRLFGLIKRLPLQNAAIIGPRRSGKTSLLYYLMKICTTPESELRPGQRRDWLPNPEQYCWVYVDFQDVRVHTRLGLMAHLLSEIGIQWPVSAEPSLEIFMEIVSENLQKPTVILMDEMEVCLSRCPELDDEFWESFRSLASTQTQGLLSVILSISKNPREVANQNGRSSPFFNIFGYVASLKPLLPSEADQLLKNSSILFSTDEADWIFEKSQLWPMKIQYLCREKLLNMNFEDLEEDWRDEAELMSEEIF